MHTVPQDCFDKEKSSIYHYGFLIQIWGNQTILVSFYKFYIKIILLYWKRAMATHSSILAWRIPMDSGLQSMGWQRAGHYCVTKHTAHILLYRFLWIWNDTLCPYFIFWLLPFSNYFDIHPCYLLLSSILLYGYITIDPSVNLFTSIWFVSIFLDSK